MNTHNSDRRAILELVRAYAETKLATSPFLAGITTIPASGKVLGPEELVNLVDASLDAWLTTGRFNDAFEKKLAAYLAGR